MLSNFGKKLRDHISIIIRFLNQQTQTSRHFWVRLPFPLANHEDLYIRSMLLHIQVAQIEEVSKQAEKSGNSKEKERKLKELLVKSFPVIKIKQLRPVKINHNPCKVDICLKITIRISSYKFGYPSQQSSSQKRNFSMMT